MRKKNTRVVSWGMPAQIADSREAYRCGRCGSQRGVYGKDFGIAACRNTELGVIQGEPLPLNEYKAFDVTETRNSICGKCWNCEWAYYMITGDPEPDTPPKKQHRRRKKKK
ncbi:MAG: hypothetical protein ACYTBZ_30215 [Planctomycetota bacterium]|jgi:ribosomal protein S14